MTNGGNMVWDITHIRPFYKRSLLLSNLSMIARTISFILYEWANQKTVREKAVSFKGNL